MLQAHVERYVDSLRCAERTRIEYGRDLSLFINWMQKHNITVLTAAAIEVFLGTLRRPNGASYAAATRNRMLTVLKGYLAFLVKDRLLAENPATGVRTQRKLQRAPVFLELDEGARILLALRNQISAQSKRNMALLTLMLGSGLRVSEIVGLNVDTWQDALRHGWLTIIGKGNKERIVPPSEEAIERVQAYVAVRPQVPADRTGFPLFVSRNNKRISTERIEQIVRELAVQAGITKRITPHRLRATWVTQLLISGANPREVQAMAGHTSLDTTMLYAGVRRNEALRQTVQRHQVRYA